MPGRIGAGALLSNASLERRLQETADGHSLQLLGDNSLADGCRWSHLRKYRSGASRHLDVSLNLTGTHYIQHSKSFLAALLLQSPQHLVEPAGLGFDHPRRHLDFPEAGAGYPGLAQVVPGGEGGPYGRVEVLG